MPETEDELELERRCRAYHEAAHAVVAFWLGRNFSRVSMSCFQTCPPDPIGVWAQVGEIMMYMAGGLAIREFVTDAEPHLEGDAVDRKEIDRNIQSIAQFMKEHRDHQLDTEQAIRDIREQTRQFMKIPEAEKSIEALAKALHEKGRLNYREAVKIMTDAGMEESIAQDLPPRNKWGW